jgi:Short C-terminal domain
MREDEQDFERLRELKEMQFDMTTDQIRKLSGLRDEGLLTDEEFTAKKAELLSRL